MKLPRFAWIALMLSLAPLTGCMKEPVTPASASDEVVFRPTGEEYPREVMVVSGKPYDVVLIKLRTVAEAAQMYADFSKKEVRVPRNLLEKPLPGDSDLKAAVGNVASSMEFTLPLGGVEIVSHGSDAAVIRACEVPFGRMVAKAPASATSEQVAAAMAAMNQDRFWELIEAASRSGRGDGFRMAASLQAALAKLRAEEILGFQLRMNERAVESYRWDLWAVAYIINGGASDDGFEYFRGWLISQGRAYYEAALKDPVRAADRAGQHQQNENEQILYSAMEAYQAKTGKTLPALPYSGSTSPAGKPWKEEDLSKLYPELTKRF
jgi:hypothetical protein